MTSLTQQGGPYLHGGDVPLVELFDAALFDLDGVVYRGPEAIEHAVESIGTVRSAGLRTVFVTNNANREPQTVADHLVRLGIPATGAEVMTSAMAAAAIVAREFAPGARVLAVGGPGLREALAQEGLTVVDSADDAPAVVVQGFAPAVSWVQLTEAAYAIQGGARFVATNLDETIPTERGIAPGNGSLVAVVVAATGVEPASAGKPKPEIFRQAAARVGAQRPIVVGDRLDTDIAGAAAAGMASLQVLTGVDDARAVVLAAPEERPRYVAEDLRGLLVAHPAPRRAVDGWWVCVDVAARVRTEDGVAQVRLGDGAVLTLDDGAAEVPLDAVRALCCAAWEAVDDGRPLAAVPDLRVVDAAREVPSV